MVFVSETIDKNSSIIIVIEQIRSYSPTLRVL